MSKTKPGRWLDRTLLRAPCMALCLNEKDFHNRLKYLKVVKHDYPAFEKPGRIAAAISFENADKNTTVLVVLNDWENRPPLDIVISLVHESVHVWQVLCKEIGETNPGDEQEAYAIQNITKVLLDEFVRQTR